MAVNKSSRNENVWLKYGFVFPTKLGSVRFFKINLNFYFSASYYSKLKTCFKIHILLTPNDLVTQVKMKLLACSLIQSNGTSFTFLCTLMYESKTWVEFQILTHSLIHQYMAKPLGILKQDLRVSLKFSIQICKDVDCSSLWIFFPSRIINNDFENPSIHSFSSHSSKRLNRVFKESPKHLFLALFRDPKCSVGHTLGSSPSWMCSASLQWKVPYPNQLPVLPGKKQHLYCKLPLESWYPQPYGIKSIWTQMSRP